MARLGTWGRFVEHLSDLSVTRFRAMTIMNLVTLKAAAKCDLLFYKPSLTQSGVSQGTSTWVSSLANLRRGWKFPAVKLFPAYSTSVLITAVKSLVAQTLGAKQHNIRQNCRQTLNWGRFVEQKLILSSNFRCYQIHSCQRYDFGHTLLCYLSLTWLFNKPTSGASNFSSNSAVA